MDLARQTNDHREEADAMLATSNLLAGGNCWGDAVHLLKEAVSRYAESGNKPGEARALLQLAQARKVRVCTRKPKLLQPKPSSSFRMETTSGLK